MCDNYHRDAFFLFLVNAKFRLEDDTPSCKVRGNPQPQQGYIVKFTYRLPTRGDLRIELKPQRLWAESLTRCANLSWVGALIIIYSRTNYSNMDCSTDNPIIRNGRRFSCQMRVLMQIGWKFSIHCSINFTCKMMQIGSLAILAVKGS